MTSQAAVAGGLSGARGLVFLGFPLHPPGKPSTERGDHLGESRQPLLFLQGTRESFADLDLLRPVCASLGDRARLHVIEGADHSFHVTKVSGRTDGEVQDELVQVTADWARSL
jgi:predicted alpha/beta-hydrolase family hydrolase